MAWHRFKTFLQKVIERIGIWRDHLMLVRIPLFIVIAGAVLTLRVDQVQELFYLLGRSAERHRLHGVMAVVMALTLGFAVWYTARILFRFRYPARPALQGDYLAWLRVWLPRVLGPLVPALMALGCWGEYLHAARNQKDFAELFALIVYTLGFAAEAVLIFVLVTFRRAILRRVARGRVRLAEAPPDDPRLDHFRQLEKPGRWFLYSGVVVNIALFLGAWIWPWTVGWMGPLAIIMVTAFCFTLTGGLVLIFTERAAFPILTLATLWMVLLQTLHWDDNHHVRQSAAAASWRAQSVPAAGGAPAAQAIAARMRGNADAPVFLVAAEGGGIRAAAWAALVLARLQAESDGAFAGRYVAGSGVSGGSLGLATFSAMLAHEPALAPRDYACAPVTDNMRGCIAERFLTRDFMGPLLTNMLVVDQAQRLFPYPVFPDRGSVLERAWERGWRRAAGRSDRAFSNPWRDLSGASGATPILFLNSTRVDNGQRFIQQPLALDAKRFASLFPGATDSTHWLGPDTPLGTVVHNSARFTYVSPAGTLDPPADSSLAAIQLVDGGYFENSGEATLQGVMRLLTEPLGDGPPATSRRNVYVIHISNDPAVPSLLDDGSDSCRAPDERQATDVPRYGEIAAPVFALLDTREGRGEVSRRAMKSALCKDHLFHFRLCEGMHHLPLGWTLSEDAWAELDRQLGSGVAVAGETRNIAANREQLRRIARLAQAGASDAAACE